jgi:IS5 family transposase
LICGDEATVYADKAYDSQARRVRLKEMGIRDGIMRRHNRWLRLGPWAVRRNAVISHLRAPVEPLFALLKRVLTRFNSPALNDVTVPTGRLLQSPRKCGALPERTGRVQLLTLR